MRKAVVVFIAMAIMSVCCISCETVGKGVTDAKVSYAYQN